MRCQTKKHKGMKEKVYIVISSWLYEKCSNIDKSINFVSKDINKTKEKLKNIKDEELAINAQLWSDIFEKQDSSDYFFIMNNNGDWFEVDIVEKEID